MWTIDYHEMLDSHISDRRRDAQFGCLYKIRKTEYMRVFSILDK